MVKNTFKHKGFRGFTIVELLVVITIIAILSTIAIASYSSSKKKQRDSSRSADIAMIQNSLGEYRDDNGEYPFACTNNDIECPIDSLAVYLIPKYMLEMPHDPKFSANPNNPYLDYLYIHNDEKDSYGIRVSNEIKDPLICKAGKNMSSTWWGSETPSCDIDSNVLP